MPTITQLLDFDETFMVLAQKGLVWPVDSAGIFREADYFAAEVNSNCAPFISSLFGMCGPSTIGRLVRAVHVNSFQRQSIRALSHIFQKVRKAVLPSVAHRNPSSSIPDIGRAVWLIASFFGFLPSGVLSGAGTKSRCSVNYEGNCSRASARLGLTRTERISKSSKLLSAVAFHNPSSSAATFTVGRSGDDSQFSEALQRQISSQHEIVIPLSRHECKH